MMIIILNSSLFLFNVLFTLYYSHVWVQLYPLTQCFKVQTIELNVIFNGFHNLRKRQKQQNKKTFT